MARINHQRETFAQMNERLKRVATLAAANTGADLNAHYFKLVASSTCLTRLDTLSQKLFELNRKYGKGAVVQDKNFVPSRRYTTPKEGEEAKSLPLSERAFILRTTNAAELQRHISQMTSELYDYSLVEW
jgi:hypothetical protein